MFSSNLSKLGKFNTRFKIKAWGIKSVNAFSLTIEGLWTIVVEAEGIENALPILRCVPVFICSVHTCAHTYVAVQNITPAARTVQS